MRSLKLKSGTVIGHFRIERELGKGGMAHVYLAKDLTLSRFIALKVLDHDKLHNIDEKQKADLRKRFLRETKTAALIHHQNIAQLFEANFDRDNWFYAMEYVDGSTLRDLLAKGKKFSVPEILELMKQLISGLKFAWDKFRIIHRDINPLNIMLTSDNTLKIVDLGLAKSTDGFEHGEGFAKITVTGIPIGTPYYMAPEQAVGKKELDNRVDIFGMGVTLYEICTRKRAFSGGSTYQIYQAQIAKKYDSIRLYRDDIPLELEQLLYQMLEPECEDRISSYDEILDVLNGPHTILSTESAIRFVPLKPKSEKSE